MIVIPALAGIVAILEPVVVGAVIGVTASTAFCAAGGAVTGVQHHGSAGEVATSAIHSTQSCAEDGTLLEAGLVGGAFGGVIHVAGPVLNAGAKTVMAAADDLLRPVGQIVDDFINWFVQGVDDVLGPLFGRQGPAARPVNSVVNAPSRIADGTRNAQQYRNLPRNVCRNGCNYTMADDVSGATKSGITTRHPSRRLAEVSRDLGRPVNYRSIHPGNNLQRVKETERAIHQTFARQRNTSMPGREWFDLNPIDQLSVRAWTP